VVPTGRHPLRGCVVSGAGASLLVAARITRGRNWHGSADAITARARPPLHFPDHRPATPALASIHCSASACAQSRGVAGSGSDRRQWQRSSASQRTPATKTASAGASPRRWSAHPAPEAGSRSVASGASAYPAARARARAGEVAGSRRHEARARPLCGTRPSTAASPRHKPSQSWARAAAVDGSRPAVGDGARPTAETPVFSPAAPCDAVAGAAGPLLLWVAPGRAGERHRQRRPRTPVLQRAGPDACRQRQARVKKRSERHARRAVSKAHASESHDHEYERKRASSTWRSLGCPGLYTDGCSMSAAHSRVSFFCRGKLAGLLVFQTDRAWRHTGAPVPCTDGFLPGKARAGCARPGVRSRVPAPSNTSSLDPLPCQSHSSGSTADT